MNILISNDDGYQSKGIEILAKVASKFAKILVVAPDRNKTATSNSLTLHKPLRINKSINGFYYVNGTPTDCVHLAMGVMHDFKPDFVFAGVNHGANLGDDTLYSGTVAAAMEGYQSGVPSVAFSLNDKEDSLYWDTVEEVLNHFIQYLIEINSKNPKLYLLNVNIPSIAKDKIKGYKVVKLGKRIHGNSIFESTDPYGKPVYWLGEVGDSSEIGSNTDFVLIEEGYVTITPLTLDLTQKDTLELFKNNFEDLNSHK